MENKNKIKAGYYFISPEYLEKIFTKEELIKNKYKNRPFVGFSNSDILISISEKNLRNDKEYELCYYFNNNKNLLPITSLIFVPLKERRTDIYFNNLPENILKLKELEDNFLTINKKIGKCLSLNKYSRIFENAHPQITKSKQIYKQILIQEIKKLTEENARLAEENKRLERDIELEYKKVLWTRFAKEELEEQKDKTHVTVKMKLVFPARLIKPAKKGNEFESFVLPKLENKLRNSKKKGKKNKKEDKLHLDK